jgi:hypothetical protein
MIPKQQDQAARSCDADPLYIDVRDQIDRERPRELPSNVEAEQALLGALLCDNREFARIAEIVRPEDFAWGVHGRIFDAIGKLVGGGTKANPVTLRHFFDNDPALPKPGGGAYLSRLAVSAVTVSNGPDYALIISDLALRRDLIAELFEPKPSQTTLGVITDYRPRIEGLAKAVRDLAPARRGANAG